jgi:hypothetical protein
VAQAEQAGQSAEVVAAGEGKEDPGQLQRVHRLSPPKGVGKELDAEGEVEGCPVTHQLGPVAEIGELDHGLERGRLAGQVVTHDPGQPLNRKRHGHARIDEELELAEGYPVAPEADRPDLDDALALGG